MLAYLFIAIAIAVRFLPHAFHFTPVGAALLFFGARQPRRQMWVPVLLMAIADMALNKFVYQYAVTWQTFVSTAWYALAILIGSGLLKRDQESGKYNVAKLAGASLAGSISFFLISNFAVWASWTMYPRTLAGLAECYFAAVPFFRNTLASDLIFTLAIFAVPVAITAAKRMGEVGSSGSAA